MNFPRFQPSVRVFYLGDSNAPYSDLLLSKNGGAFAAPTNRLVAMGHGWYSLILSSRDTDTLGPLAWFVAGTDFISQPQDRVVALDHGTIDQTALDLAFADLAAGYPAGIRLNEMLERPLFQFLLALR